MEDLAYRFIDGITEVYRQAGLVSQAIKGIEEEMGLK
jgi:hypothetical protein